MRPLVTKWDAECGKCLSALPAGSSVLYERGCGTFCPTCGPTDDELRQMRRDAMDRKATRREAWAEARQRRADRHQHRSDVLMGRDRDPSGRADWALVSQPGYIPQRAQANRAQERAWEEQRAASHHAGIAASLRATPALVKGDTAKRREEANERARARVLEWIEVGMLVVGNPFPEPMRVLRLNRKTVTLKGGHGDWKVAYRDVERAG